VSRRILVCFVLCLVTSAMVSGAEFWDVKPFLDWTDKEVQRILSDSPWAAIMAVPLPNAGPVPSGDVGGSGRGGGGSRGESFGPGPRRVRLTISWRSALPIRQAAVRQQAGLHGSLSPDAQALLAKDDEFYVIGVQGLPPQYSRGGTGTTIESFLRREGKPPIPAQRAGSQPIPGGALLVIGFPRTDPITLDDGDVEFDVKVENLHFKKKFKLKDLVFAGKLAL
jgi:hypothetical protein